MLRPPWPLKSVEYPARTLHRRRERVERGEDCADPVAAGEPLPELKLRYYSSVRMVPSIVVTSLMSTRPS